MKDLEQALTLTPSANQADILLDRAMLYAIAKDKSKALADLEEALKRDPKLPRGQYLKGMALLDQKNYDQAIAKFSEAIRLNDKYADAWCFRGKAKMAKKEIEPAVADFTKAIELNKKLLAAYSGRNDAYKKLKKPAEAAADYAKIKELEAADPKLAKKAAPAPKKKEEPTPRFVVTSKPVAPDKLKQAQLSAKEVDRLVAANYAKYKIEPNPLTTDEQFVRRIYLDITGTIPTYQQTVTFLTDKESAEAVHADRRIARQRWLCQPFV